MKQKLNLPLYVIERKKVIVYFDDSEPEEVEKSEIKLADVYTYYKSITVHKNKKGLKRII